jgi:hypothetical protein
MQPFNLPWEEYEAYGPEIENVDVRLIVLLHDLNEYTGNRLYVHCLYDEDRKPKNLHRQGLACDGHIEAMSLIDQYVCISRFPFKGIGLYPVWKPEPGGFHVDIRNQRIGARWGCKKKGEYVSLNTDFFYHILQKGGMPM